jgi:hypothetical protein
MDREELRALWDRNKDRPAFVREHREAIHGHTETSDPIPDGSLAEVRRWLESYKGTVTRQLNDESPGTDPQDAETTTDDGGEGEGE